MNIAFRTDASRVIGTGHLMRCLTLADAFQASGARCHFVCRDHDGIHATLLRDRGFELFELPPPATPIDGKGGYRSWLGVPEDTDAMQTIDVLKETKIDWLIVDHYALDARWETAVRLAFKRVGVIDDLADRKHDCDLLVDPGTDPALPGQYAKLTPDYCLRLVGPQFAILRPEFDVARRAVVPRSSRKVQSIVLLFGGSDTEHNTLEAMEAISSVGDARLSVDVIVSPANLDRDKIVAFCSRSPDFTAHVATDKVAELFAQADFAMGSGGSATYERLYLQLPCLLKVIAENQRRPLTQMASMGLIDLYTDKDELRHKLSEVLGTQVSPPPDIVRNGVAQIRDAMLPSGVELRRPTPSDIRRTYYWLQNPELRRSFRLKDKPEPAGHVAYWRRLLDGDGQYAFSAYRGQRHIGNAGLKNITPEQGHAELWLYIGDASERGQGTGKHILMALERYIKDELGITKVVLHVSEDNLPASALYRGSGYRVLNDVSAEFDTSSFGRVLRMEKNL